MQKIKGLKTYKSTKEQIIKKAQKYKMVHVIDSKTGKTTQSIIQYGHIQQHWELKSAKSKGEKMGLELCFKTIDRVSPSYV